MLKARVRRTCINITSIAELVQIAQALKLRCVDELDKRRMKDNLIVNTVVEYL